MCFVMMYVLPFVRPTHSSGQEPDKLYENKTHSDRYFIDPVWGKCFVATAIKNPAHKNNGTMNTKQIEQEEEKGIQQK